MTLEKWACWASTRNIGDSKVDALLKENENEKKSHWGLDLPKCGWLQPGTQVLD